MLLIIMNGCLLVDAVEGFSDLRLEERRKNFVVYIYASTQCFFWLVDTVEAACLVKEDVAKSYREGDKALMVHGGANKAGRFLEVFVYVEGGHKGVLWLMKGCFGRGWHRFAGELRLMLVSPTGKIGSEVFEARNVPRLQIPLNNIGVGSLRDAQRIVPWWRSCNQSLDLSWRIGRTWRRRKAGLSRGMRWKVS
jgi:hypothetical protein